MAYICPLEFDDLEPGKTVQERSCAECRQTVTDLSTMSEPRARAWARDNPGRCVRFLRRADGSWLRRQPVARLAQLAVSITLVGRACGSPTDPGHLPTDAVEESGTRTEPAAPAPQASESTEDLSEWLEVMGYLAPDDP